MPKKGTSVMQRLVKNWMWNEIRIRELDAGQVNMTMLAEEAAHAFDRDDWLDDPDHWVWDAAADMLNEDE